MYLPCEKNAIYIAIIITKPVTSAKENLMPIRRNGMIGNSTRHLGTFFGEMSFLKTFLLVYDSYTGGFV
jgi:hypothetical protein